jgi:lipoprotein-releasing system permease protein
VGLPPDLALTVALVATAAGVLAAVAPARRAARLDPAQAIRL